MLGEAIFQLHTCISCCKDLTCALPVCLVSITKVVTGNSRTSTLSLDEQRKKQLKNLKKGYLLEVRELGAKKLDVLPDSPFNSVRN